MTTAVEISSLIAGPLFVVRIDPYGANPLADDYEQVNAATYAAALSEGGPPPKMFSAGTSDTPAFTASGLDPKLLLKLPYTARHAVAAEPDLATVHGIFEQSADDPFLTIWHEGFDAAIARVRTWAIGRTAQVIQ